MGAGPEHLAGGDLPGQLAPSPEELELDPETEYFVEPDEAFTRDDLE
jgi:hypothetical protein